MAPKSKDSGGRKKSGYSAKALKAAESDLAPDAWPKFEKLIKSAAKLGLKPHKDGK